MPPWALAVAATLVTDCVWGQFPRPQETGDRTRPEYSRSCAPRPHAPRGSCLAREDTQPSVSLSGLCSCTVGPPSRGSSLRHLPAATEPNGPALFMLPLVAIEAVLGNEAMPAGPSRLRSPPPAARCPPRPGQRAGCRCQASVRSHRRPPWPTSHPRSGGPGAAPRPSPFRPRVSGPTVGLGRSPRRRGRVSSGTWKGERRLVDSVA